MPRIAFILLIHCSILFTQAQTLTPFCEQVIALNALIEQAHYSPKPINDSLSKGVYTLFLKTLDPDAEFFLQSDIEKFNLDTYLLDNYLLDKDCSFIDIYFITLEQRIQETKQYITALQEETLDYSGKDTLYFNSQKNQKYFDHTEAAKAYWNKRIRYKIAARVLDEDSLNSNIDFTTLEHKLKTKVIDSQRCILDEMLTQQGGITNFVKESFLNALLQYQDPNSLYFNPSDKVLFENSLSSSEFSFGIHTEKNSDGDIVIAYITPGSAASLHGGFEENDIVQSLSCGNDVLEAYCISNNDILAFTNNANHHTVVFKIKKQDGTIHQIELTKSLTDVVNNKTESFILQGDKTLGYIKIANFYTPTESLNDSGLSKDVAKELFKLLKAQIDGLILDLRFNGGGSMKEATDLASMFIPRGPISVLKYNTGETFTVKNSKKGALFHKPILILVNHYSASAAEYFAAAMQDYHRAILAGTPTHGKASAQIILPLSETKNLGYGKLTVEKFYRITGKSHQTIGLTPDIVLPTLFDNIEIGEQYEPYALQNDSIALHFSHQPLKKMDFSGLIAKSYQRVNSSTYFKKIKKLNQKLVSNYVNKNVVYPLTFKTIHDDITNYFKIWEDFNNLFIKKTETKFNILYPDDTKNHKNTTSFEENTDDILKDIYIEEAYNIMLDYINLVHPN